MIEGLEIRKLRKEDLPQIARIQQVITKKPIPLLMHELASENLDKPTAVSFAAVLENEVVGFMTGECKRGAFGIEESFWIEMMGVHPRFMGQGIGRALGRKLFEFCKEQGIRDVYTTVRWDWVDLLSFFKTMGFDRSNFINLKKHLE